MNNNKIDNSKIIAAGRDMTRIGRILVSLFIMDFVATIIYFTNFKSNSDILYITIILIALISFILIIILIVSIFSAGWNLKNCFFEEELVLSPEQKHQSEEEIKSFGGVLIKINDGHKIAVQTEDLGSYDWEKAIEMASKNSNGEFTDWRVPTIEELMVINKNRIKIGGLKQMTYWSSSKVDSYHSWAFFFNYEEVTSWQGDFSHKMVKKVRLVRNAGEKT